jgi:hypothetical protein
MSYLLQEILKKHDIVSYLAERGIMPDQQVDGRFKYKCPVHDDSTPSFIVYAGEDKQHYYCFGCLHEDEPVWTYKGLKRIGDVAVDDLVWDRYGGLSRVIAVEHKLGDTVLLSLGSFRQPLELTGDHTCLYVKGRDAVASLPYLHSVGPRVKFSSRAKSRARSAAFKGCLRFTQGPASEVVEGDYFAFPVHPVERRLVLPRWGCGCIREYSKGPRVDRVESLPVTKRAMRLYGLYLAEGSVCSSGRVLRFSFNIREADTLAAEVMETLASEFGLPSSISLRPEKGLCEVDCCKVDLCQQLQHFFGSGCGDKRVPFQVMMWPQEYQRALVSGYRDGDGVEVTPTVSPHLAYGIYALCIQAEMMPSLSVMRPYIGKDGSSRRARYTLGYKERESLNGFFETVGETTYYFSRVTKSERGLPSRRVVDISVAGSESFVTKLGVVHNCKAHGDIIDLKAAVEKIDVGDAIRSLAHGIDVTNTDEVKWLVSNIEERKITIEESDIEVLALQVSRYIYHFMKGVNHDTRYAEATQQVLMLLDDAVYRLDVERVRDIYHELMPYLDDALDEYTVRKDREMEEVSEAYA